MNLDALIHNAGSCDVIPSLNEMESYRLTQRRFYSPFEVVEFVKQQVGEVGTTGDRSGEIPERRQVAIWLIKRKFPKMTLQSIGEVFNTDHSTVLYSIKTVNNRCEVEKAYREKYHNILTA